MKIFGIDLSLSPPPAPPAVKVKDQIPEIKVSVPDTKKPATIPAVKDPTLNYGGTRNLGRGAFQSAEYDLAEIGKIEDTDSYVMQAFEKKVALMFKEGWDLVGPNLRTIKYIRARFEQIAAASKMPTNELFRSIGSAVIKKANAFVVKVRKTDASGGRERSEPGKTATLKPVAAYFIAPAESMEFEMSSNRITGWRQCMPNGDIQEFAPKDIIHITHNKKEGFTFGTPTIIPVIDDIRALRKIEENIELLVYQHLFPLFQYKVGTETMPATTTETGEREIDVVRKEIQFMPTEGGIVTDFRHEIKAIGAEGRALRAEGYLEHFKKRVFAGLGVSSVDMGEGETANRATADNMSRNLVDGVKDLQQVVEVAISEFIIKELLLESTFGEDVLAEENMVKLKFREIDQEAKVKKESHAADLFTKDIITHDEARQRLGLEPLKLPTFDEVQEGTDEPDQYPEWSRMRWKLFEEPKLLIQAMDEPYSAAAKAAAKAPTTEVAQEDLDTAMEEENEQEMELEKEKTKAKVAVAKARPRPKPAARRDGYLAQTFTSIKEDTIKRVSEKQKIEHDWVASLVRTQMRTTINRLITEQALAFRRGYARYQSIESDRFIVVSSTARRLFRDRAEQYISKLTENLVSSLKRNVTNDDPAELVRTTRAVFESLAYRTDFIEDVEVRKAKSYGEAIGIRDTDGGVTILGHKSSNKDSCATCTTKGNEEIDSRYVTLDDVPPYHANCNCFLVSPIFDTIKDSFETEILEDLDEDLEDATLEECVLSVKKSLKKRNPGWSSDKIKSSAYAICNSRMKGK